MMGDIIAWMISFTLVITLIGIIFILFQLMCLLDLGNDYINPYDSATRINSVVLPEFVISGVLCFLHLISGHWIFNLIPVAKRIRFYKLGYLAVALIFSIFWCRFKRVLGIINYGALG